LLAWRWTVGGVFLALEHRVRDAGGVDVQPSGFPRARERRVRPALGEVTDRGEDGGVLDGAALHAVPGQAVGVRDMLSGVAGWQFADGAGVGVDDDPVRMGGADGSAGAVVDVDDAVVAPADDAIGSPRQEHHGRARSGRA